MWVFPILRPDNAAVITTVVVRMGFPGDVRQEAGRCSAVGAKSRGDRVHYKRLIVSMRYCNCAANAPLVSSRLRGDVAPRGEITDTRSRVVPTVSAAPTSQQ